MYLPRKGNRVDSFGNMRGQTEWKNQTNRMKEMGMDGIIYGGTAKIKNNLKFHTEI